MWEETSPARKDHLIGSASLPKARSLTDVARVCGLFFRAQTDQEMIASLDLPNPVIGPKFMCSRAVIGKEFWCESSLRNNKSVMHES